MNKEYLLTYLLTIFDAGFFQKGYLKMHIESVHEGKKPYKCTVRGSNFSIKQNLNRHSLVLKGKKPFKCNICDATFSRKESLTLLLKITKTD